jgi:hypothetical protein
MRGRPLPQRAGGPRLERPPAMEPLAVLPPRRTARTAPATTADRIACFGAEWAHRVAGHSNGALPRFATLVARVSNQTRSTRSSRRIEAQGTVHAPLPGGWRAAGADRWRPVRFDPQLAVLEWLTDVRGRIGTWPFAEFPVAERRWRTPAPDHPGRADVRRGQRVRVGEMLGRSSAEIAVTNDGVSDPPALRTAGRSGRRWDGEIHDPVRST